MANPLWVIAQGTAAILGITVDSQSVVSHVSGSTEIDMGTLPDDVHIYVGDAIQIPYDITFKFKNSLLDPNEVILFEFRAYLDGNEIGHTDVGLIRDSDTTWHAKGEFWIGGTNYDCDDTSKNAHQLSFVATMIDFSSMIGDPAIVMDAWYKGIHVRQDNSPLPDTQKEQARNNGWIISTRNGILGVEQFKAHNVQIHVHNPYFIESAGGVPERDHSNPQNESTISYKAKVNYRLSTGSHQVIRPDHGDALMLPVSFNKDWTITQKQPAGPVFRLEPPRDEQFIQYSGIHNGDRHPGKICIANENLRLIISGKNFILSGSDQQTFSWRTLFRKDSNSNDCGHIEYAMSCIDDEKYGLDYLDYGEFASGDSVAATIARDDGHYFLTQEKGSHTELNVHSSPLKIDSPLPANSSLILGILTDSMELALSLFTVHSTSKQGNVFPSTIFQENSQTILIWKDLKPDSYELLLGDHDINIKIMFDVISDTEGEFNEQKTMNE